MRVRLCICLILTAFFCSVPVVFGQAVPNAGSIYGKVTDQAGTPLVGVTIVLEDSGAGRKQQQTGAGGFYRFSGLPPSMYILTFSIEGFTELRQENIVVRAGSAMEIEATLEKSLVEKLVVRSETPFIDTRSTTTTSYYDQRYLTVIPSSRDPWSILDQTPGVDESRINVGGADSGARLTFIARGGTFSQNTYNYDGMDITPASGGIPAFLDYGSFDEIVVSTGALDPAIDRGGVVVSFVTKSAGNRWSGQLNSYYTGDALQTDNVDKELRTKHFNRAGIINEAFNYGGDLGGPLIKDQLWIWGGYRYEKITTSTPELIFHNTDQESLKGTIMGGEPITYELTNYNLKLNTSYSATQEGTFQFYRSRNNPYHVRAWVYSSGPVTTLNQQEVDRFFKAEHTWSNAGWYLNAKFAYLPGGSDTEPVAGRSAQPVVRANHDFTTENGAYWIHRDHPQQNFAFDGSHFVENKLGGDHELKFGFAYKNSTVIKSSQYGGDALLYDYSGSRGDRSAGSGLALLIYQTTESIRHRTFGSYLGDTWHLSRLTLNLGARFSVSNVKNNPTHAPANQVAPDLIPALSFEAKTPAVTFRNLSPRLGATFDVTGSGKTVVRGNYARFYDSADIFYAEFQSPIGHERGVYTGLYVYYTDANGDGTVTRDELLTQYGIYLIRGLIPGDPQATADNFSKYHFVDPGLRAQSTDEYLWGVTHELFRDFSVGITYTHRKYDHIQDSYIPGVTAGDFVCGPFVIQNLETGQQFTVNDCRLPDTIPNQDSSVLLSTIGRTRSYDGVELRINKRMSDRWMLRFSGTYQSQKIHYAKNGNVFGGSFQNPANIGITDGQWWTSDTTGNLGSDWSWKASGTYIFPYDITAGVYLKLQHGYVVPIVGGGLFHFSYAEGQHRALVAPPDTVRLPDIVYTDMQIEKELRLKNHGSLHLSATIFNLFNINAIQTMNGRVRSFQFLEPTQIVNPRVFRLGLRYTF